MWRTHLESLVPFGQIGYRLHVFTHEVVPNSGTTFMLAPTLQTVEPNGQADPDKTAFLSDGFPFPRSADVKGFLQAMTDAAWEIGIRPKQLDHYSGELVAVRYHLEDLRRIVFNKDTL